MWIGSFTFDSSRVDVPDNPYLIRGWSSFGEEVTISDLKKREENVICHSVTMSSLRYKLDNAGRLSRSRNTRTAPYMGTKTAKRIGLRTPNLGCREGVKECVAERSVCGGCSEGICSFDNQWFVGQRTRQSVPGSSEDRVMVRLTICVETSKKLSLEGSCDTMWLENR